MMLTIGTRPREVDLAEAAPFAAPFDLEWLEQALQRRSKSDFSNNTVLLEADSAAIFSSALDRISRAMSTARATVLLARDRDGYVGGHYRKTAGGKREE